MNLQNIGFDVLYPNHKKGQPVYSTRGLLKKDNDRILYTTNKIRVKDTTSLEEFKKEFSKLVALEYYGTIKEMVIYIAKCSYTLFGRNYIIPNKYISEVYKNWKDLEKIASIKDIKQKLDSLDIQLTWNGKPFRLEKIKNAYLASTRKEALKALLN